MSGRLIVMQGSIRLKHGMVCHCPGKKPILKGRRFSYTAPLKCLNENLRQQYPIGFYLLARYLGELFHQLLLG